MDKCREIKRIINILVQIKLVNIMNKQNKMII